jgi:hypothetical protein
LQNKGKPFRYSAVHCPFSPRKIEIAEACSAIFKREAEMEAITEDGSSIYGHTLCPSKCPGLYADHAVAVFFADPAVGFFP